MVGTYKAVIDLVSGEHIWQSSHYKYLTVRDTTGGMYMCVWGGGGGG